MPRKSRSRFSSTIVYSTDGDTHCPGCQRPKVQCVCRSKPSTSGDCVVRIARETKGRKGRGVTTVRGVPPHEVAEMGKRLRKQLGTGGTVKDGVIEVQGDHVGTLVTALTAFGYDTRPRPS